MEEVMGRSEVRMGCRRLFGKLRLSTLTGMCRRLLEIMGHVHGLPRVLSMDLQ